MIIDWIQLKTSTATWKIATNLINRSDTTETFIVVAQDGIAGLIDMGGATVETKERSYGHGSILPPKMYYRGKEITVTLLFFGGASLAYQNYRALTSQLGYGSRFTLSSNLGATYNCVMTSTQVDEGLNENYLIATYTMSAEEAF